VKDAPRAWLTACLDVELALIAITEDDGTLLVAHALYRALNPRAAYDRTRQPIQP
jgi:hypothetical protein